jgi:hypothetical protein
MHATSGGCRWRTTRFEFGLQSRLLLLLVLGAALSGCGLYHKQYPLASLPTPGYQLHTVQVDDFGTFWDAHHANDVLANVDTSAQKTNTFVVLFIHGWHHNADPEDSNLRDFNDTLNALNKTLRGETRTALRKQLTGDPDFRLIGIYVGWRGRTLPGVLDYATMWWRKTAAERVGDGDVSEFIERLQRIYLRANSINRPPKDSPIKPFMGLITMGHSFGGQVLLKSVARPLEFALTQRAPCLAEVTGPPQNSSNPAPVRSAVASLGDLNILLNPAAEAYQFGRIDALYRQLKYPMDQTPQLVVFSAENDVPREAFFPIARFLTLPFRPTFRNDYQAQLWGQALGILETQHTHLLTRTVDSPDSLTESDYATERGRRVKEHDFTGETTFGGIRLAPRTDVDPQHAPIENSPVAVVVTRDDIINGHNEIFHPDFQGFLASYVAFIEGKRVLLRNDRFYAMASAADRSTPAAQPEVAHPIECRYQDAQAASLTASER